MDEILLSKEIRLDQFLKWINVASSGGQGKVMIQSGLIKVNGQVETRRGKILQQGDRIEVGGAGLYQVNYNK